MADPGKEEPLEDQGKEPVSDDQETNPTLESIVPEQVVVKTEENVQEMLVESPVPEVLAESPVPEGLVESPVPQMVVGSPVPVTQDVVQMDESPLEQTAPRDEGGTIDTEATGTAAVENKNVSVETERNVQEMLVESPVSVTQEAMAELPLERTTQSKHDGSPGSGVANVTATETEDMETNQDRDKHNDSEHIVSVNDSANVSEQGDTVEEHSGASTELASELMETDEMAIKDDCVTQKDWVTLQVTTSRSGDEDLRVGMADGEVKDTMLDLHLSDAAGDHDRTMLHASVAMDIDEREETSDSRSVQKSEGETGETISGRVQLSEISQSVESNQQGNSGDALSVTSEATPMLLMDSKISGGDGTREALAQADIRSMEDGDDTTSTADT